MRTGLRICGARGNREVRDALTRYARWLRAHYEFPMRVPVYLRPEAMLITRDGRSCSASVFAPSDRNVEPYIRISTGAYAAEKREFGRDNALAAYLRSLSHEIVHYFQWLETGECHERGVAVRASAMVGRYALDVDRP